VPCPSAAAVPALSPWALALLVALLGAVAWLPVRAQRRYVL